jgi:murein DD-endopeptidase MepM/ murein hydrolase activator NlpD
MDYTIRTGDNLTNIAKANNTDVATLTSLNNLSNPNLIKAGATLKLPTQPKVETPVSNPNLITPKALAPQPKIELPSAPVTAPVPSPSQNLITDMMAGYDLTQKEKEAKGFQDTGMEQYLKDIVGLQGEAKALAEEKEKAGVTTFRQDLQNLNSKILQKQAEINQDDVTLVANMRAEERRDTLLPFAQIGQAKLAGDAQIVRALKNAEIGVLNAQALAKQGDIALAQQTAEEAVAVKYAPYKERITAYENIVKALEPYLTSAEKKEAGKQTLKGQLAMKEIEKEEAKEKEISSMIIEATPNAPANIIINATNIANRGGSVLEVAQALGQYGGDYLKTELLKAQIQTEKAQKNKILAETGGDGQQYTEKQLKAITKLNQDVSKNATYAKTTAMRGYSDNVTASLSQNTGVGDIAAINQFQKVIDEGAVTRDQDVKLIQGAQSLSNTLKTKIKKLEKGEQLSPELRQQMRTSVEALYDAQIKALSKDPYIKAKTTEAGLYGLKAENTILGELGGFTVPSETQNNKFNQSLGNQAPVDYSTTGMSVQPDGTLIFVLPTNPLEK